MYAGIELAERLERDLEAGEDAVGLDQEHAAGSLRRQDRRRGGDVAVANILVERTADDVAIQPGIERLDHDAAGSRVPGEPAGPGAGS